MDSSLLSLLGVEPIDSDYLAEEPVKEALIIVEEPAQPGVALEVEITNAVHVSQKDDTKCNQCNKMFTTKSNYNRHMKMHNGTMVECNLCGKLFFTKDAQAKHRLSVHENQRLPCDEPACGKSFKTKLGLTNHKKDHIGVYRYLCPQCGKGFNYKSEFECHVVKHDEKQPFMCTKCNERFSFKTNMVRHSRTCGENGKSIKCDVCDKKFSCKRYLQEHSKAHATDDSYQCPTCGQFYKHRASLRNHVRRVHAAALGHE